MVVPTNTVMNVVRNHFKPEFLNRIDEIVVFHRLDEAHIERIVEFQVELLRERLAERNLGLELTEAALRPHRDTWATTPTSGPGRSSGCCNARSATRSRSALLKGEFHDGDIIVVDATPTATSPSAPRNPSASD